MYKDEHQESLFCVLNMTISMNIPENDLHIEFVKAPLPSSLNVAY